VRKWDGIGKNTKMETMMGIWILIRQLLLLLAKVVVVFVVVLN